MAAVARRRSPETRTLHLEGFPGGGVAVMSGGGGTATGTGCPLTLGDAGAILSYKVAPALNFQLTTEFKLLKIHRWHRTMYCLNK